MSKTHTGQIATTHPLRTIWRVGIMLLLATLLFQPWQADAQKRSKKDKEDYHDPLPKVKLPEELIREVRASIEQQERILAKGLLTGEVHWRYQSYLTVMKVKLKEENLTEKEAKEVKEREQMLVKLFIRVLSKYTDITFGEELEEELERCNWYDEMIARFSPTDVDEKVLAHDGLFKEIREHYNRYFEDSKKDNIPVKGHSGWTVRKASHNQIQGAYLIEKAILKLFSATSPEIVLHEKGVTLGTYTIEGHDYEISAFSWRENSSPEKTEVNRLCELAGHETVYAVVEDDYVQIHFLKNKDMEFSIQVNSGGERVAATWLRYLSVLVENEQDKAGTRSFWESRLKRNAEEGDDKAVYDYFVTDADAWYREKEAPYNGIKPTAENPKLARGTQVAVLEVVKDSKDKEVAKVKIRETGETEYTTLSNLTKVEKLSKELEYKLKKDFEALKLPYSSTKSDKRYKKDTKFTADKKCGNYVRVKGTDGIHGHWISKDVAVVDCGTGFCCQECGKDLTITLERLNNIFPNSTLISENSNYANLFNTALKKCSFNTCDRQAKLFAQIGHESGDFNSTIEGKYMGQELDWSLSKILTYFKRTSGAKHHWFNQEFWDDGEYKEFITVNYYEKADTLGTHNSGSSKDYYGVWRGVNQSQYHVKIPTGFTKMKNGNYKAYEVPLANKVQYRKNIFIYAYGGVLGNEDPDDNVNTVDGWKYRGKGAIQLTGKDNYRRNQNEIQKWFKISYNLVDKPDLVSDNPTVIVYSSVAYILQNIVKIEDIDGMTINQISALVNTGDANESITNVNGAPDRKSRYENLIKDENLFKCNEN